MLPLGSLQETMAEEGELDYDAVVYQCGACDEQFSSLEEIERHHSGDGAAICPYMVAAAIQPQFITGDDSEVVVMSEDVAFPGGGMPAGADEVALSEEVDDPEPAFPVAAHGHACPLCGRQFSSKFLLDAHAQSHHATETKVYSCELCRQKFYDSNEYQPQDHKCPTCGKGFTVPSNLKAHMKIHSGQRDHACDLCSKRFYTNSDLRSHKMIHTGERPYQCEICLERFTKMSNLNSHRTTHTGERPHQCEVCHKRFRKAVNLRTHRRTHAQDQTHPCSLCDQAFPNVTRLRAHNKQCHQESHACEECGRRFQSPLALVAHRRVHSGAAPFGCSLCQRSFSKEAHLHRHMDKHASRKDQCPVCQLLCSSGHQLQIHMRTHTGEKPYACDLCPRRFTKQVNLKRHLQVHTKKRARWKRAGPH
ncbi:regulator of sex-limitation, putative [Ixodes scapularis]|uniref:Regulator of sex-limitation, putative n=1 Tax=Ixodes scapularis TaxID=6945 RepID=B7QL03_IXOSC|nr:regulator of sex-limitation, putative [Ixodes scapularis]|eukprot:XP_002415858.1 regulator of sex-limitation, putative [Ixodes scapularis]